MTLFPNPSQTAALPPDDGYDVKVCRNLLNAHLKDIDKLCNAAIFKAQGGNSSVLNGGEGCLIIRPGQFQEDELYVDVIDHLQKNDYHRLRKFKGDSSFQGYLGSVIKNRLTDLVREKSGRCRAKQRAVLHGEVGLLVYEHMFVGRRTSDEAVEILSTTHGILVCPDEVRRIYDSLGGRKEKHKVDPDTQTGTGDGGEIVSIASQTPEEAAITHDQQRRLDQLFSEILSELDGEECLMVRLRFPLDPESEPLPTEEIASKMGLTKKQVDRKLRRILKRVREKLLKLGLSYDDLVVT